jgi:aldose 1-epimerase
MRETPPRGLYTANAPAIFTGRRGEQYRQYGAIVLETQHFGNSPNLPEFPTTVLRPGQDFHEITIFRFSAAK